MSTTQPNAPSDPTGSAGQRRRFETRLQDRWRSLRGNVRALLRGDRHYRPADDRIAESTQIADFRSWLEAEIADVVVEPVPHRAQRRGGHWSARFVEDLYRHGIERADESLERAGYDTGALRSPKVAVRNDPHRDRLRSYYIEVHQDLEDAARVAERDATRAYREAVRNASGIAPTASAVNDRLDKVGDTRSKLVANAKAVLIVNDASLTRYEQAGATDVGAIPESVSADRAEASAHHHDAFATDDTQPAPGEIDEQTWLTAGDRRVCPSCSDFAGITFSIEAIRNGDAPMPVRDTHPGCRCYLAVF